MQEDILGNSSIVGIEVAVVPLVSAVMLSRAVLPVIVATDSQHIAAFFQIRCQVKATSHHAILAIAQMLSVQIEVSTLAHTFELHKNLLVCHVANHKMLPIPHDGVRQVDNVLSERLVAIEGIWQCDALPPAVVVIGCLSIGGITHAQQPLSVEIQFLTLYGMSRTAKENPRH